MAGINFCASGGDKRQLALQLVAWCQVVQAARHQREGLRHAGGGAGQTYAERAGCEGTLPLVCEIRYSLSSG